MRDGILLKLLYRQSRSAANFHISFSKGPFGLRREGGKAEQSWLQNRLILDQFYSILLSFPPFNPNEPSDIDRLKLEVWPLLAPLTKTHAWGSDQLIDLELYRMPLDQSRVAVLAQGLLGLGPPNLLVGLPILSLCDFPPPEIMHHRG